MVFEPERRSSLARWSRRLAVFSAVLLAVSAISHRSGMIETVALFWLIGLVAGLALLGMGLACQSFVEIWRDARRGFGDAAFGVVLAACVLSPYAFSTYRFFAYPMLNDVSTDWINPPQLLAAQALRHPVMNEIQHPEPESISAQEAYFPDVTGRRYDLTANRLLAIVGELIAARGWTVAKLGAPTPHLPDDELAEQSEQTVDVVAYSPILALASDVSIRIVDEDTSSYVDVRSASRYGRHDLGQNARLIASLLNDLDAEVAAQRGAPPESGESDPVEEIPIPTPAPAG